MRKAKQKKETSKEEVKEEKGVGSHFVHFRTKSMDDTILQPVACSSSLRFLGKCDKQVHCVKTRVRRCSGDLVAKNWSLACVA